MSAPHFIEVGGSFVRCGGPGACDECTREEWLRLTNELRNLELRLDMVLKQLVEARLSMRDEAALICEHRAEQHRATWEHQRRTGQTSAATDTDARASEAERCARDIRSLSAETGAPS